MRLLYIHGNPIDSKSANVVQVVNMCQAFAQCGAEVTLAIPAPSKRPKTPARLVAAHLGQEPGFQVMTYKKLTLAGRLNILGNYFGAQKVVSTVQTDLCFVRDPLLLHLSIKSGLSTVFESHGIYLHEKFGILNRLWKKSVLAKAQNSRLIKFVTISYALADFWRDKGVPKHKLIVLHDGFNPHLFGSSKTRIEARQALELPLRCKIVVYSGSLKPDRDIERIIRLAKIFPETLFVVVGGYEKRRMYYENLSRSAGADNVLWIGYVPHASVATYLRSADVLLMLWTWDVPTITVCSPMKVFEYMASERIIVGEAFPTILEVLTDGETAYLANPASFDDLSNRLEYALTQEYPSPVASAARDLALQRYSWNARARGILASLEGLI